MAYILAVDDDKDILALIQKALERDGHQVDICLSADAVSLSKARFADLILLDVMMPGEDGFSYCQHIRTEVDCPILFVTALTAPEDLVHGLGIGADDYIQKPFTLAELRARVSAHLRRETRIRTHNIRVGAFRIDLAGKTILIDQTPIAFTKSEYAICVHLMEHVGQVFSKSQLYEAVFGYDGESDENVIVEHIKNIRAKIKAYHESPIETVWGIGYRWRKEQE